MQPNLSNSQSGLPYRKIVKRYFRRIRRFYLSVSVYESVSYNLFLAFLTDGNKSKCGTLLHLTHPRQPTEGPIFGAVSPSKRQVLQGKPFPLSSALPRTSPHCHTPRATPRAIRPITRPRHAPHHTPHYMPHATPPLNFACNSRTGVTQQRELIRTGRTLEGNCMRNCGTPRRPPIKVARNSPMASFIDSAKTAEYQRSDFKT